MSEDADHEADGEAGAPAGQDAVWTRSTAPQSPYTTSQVAVGFVVLVVGLLVTVGLPLALV